MRFDNIFLSTRELYYLDRLYRGSFSIHWLDNDAKEAIHKLEELGLASLYIVYSIPSKPDGARITDKGKEYYEYLKSKESEKFTWIKSNEILEKISEYTKHLESLESIAKTAEYNSKIAERNSKIAENHSKIAEKNSKIAEESSQQAGKTSRISIAVAILTLLVEIIVHFDEIMNFIFRR